MKFILILATSVFIVSCSNTVYVVRHAEKETGIDPATMKPLTDPPLSLQGNERALLLKQILGSKNVKHIYSTNTLRTISTARPLKELYLGMPIQLYNSKPDSMDVFIQRIKNIKRGDVLIVGHSNTVDDIVNKIIGNTVVSADLKDNEYDNIFMLKRKARGYKYKNEKYGRSAK
jgi:phosphohistidine phosphatase SixA